MPSINDGFRKQLHAFAKKAGSNRDRALRKIALDVLASLINKSPVKTGRFRGNWFVQEDTSPITTDATDPSGQATLAAGNAVIDAVEWGGSVYFLNHLPYAIPLEYGHSRQAPDGMVRITVAEFRQVLKKINAEM